MQNIWASLCSRLWPWGTPSGSGCCRREQHQSSGGQGVASRVGVPGKAAQVFRQGQRRPTSKLKELTFLSTDQLLLLGNQDFPEGQFGTETKFLSQLPHSNGELLEGQSGFHWKKQTDTPKRGTRPMFSPLGLLTPPVASSPTGPGPQPAPQNGTDPTAEAEPSPGEARSGQGPLSPHQHRSQSIPTAPEKIHEGLTRAKQLDRPGFDFQPANLKARANSPTSLNFSCVQMRLTPGCQRPTAGTERGDVYQH